MDYAYHFDTAFLADFLKQRCLSEGINYVSVQKEHDRNIAVA